MKKMKF
jgi:hypothetical protein